MAGRSWLVTQSTTVIPAKGGRRRRSVRWRKGASCAVPASCVERWVGTPAAVREQAPLHQRHCDRQRSNPWCGKRGGWIASSQVLLAMTGRTSSFSARASRPSLASSQAGWSEAIRINCWFAKMMGFAKGSTHRSTTPAVRSGDGECCSCPRIMHTLCTIPQPRIPVMRVISAIVVGTTFLFAAQYSADAQNIWWTNKCGCKVQGKVRFQFTHKACAPRNIACALLQAACISEHIKDCPEGKMVSVGFCHAGDPC